MNQLFKLFFFVLGILMNAFFFFRDLLVISATILC